MLFAHKNPTVNATQIQNEFVVVTDNVTQIRNEFVVVIGILVLRQVMRNPFYNVNRHAIRPIDCVSLIDNQKEAQRNT